MTWIDLGNPLPRKTPSPYEPYEWPSKEIEYLSIPEKRGLPGLEEIISRRRTRRTFGPLSRENLTSFLWWTCRVFAKGNNHLGFPITQRPVPSAGAIHPIHLLLSEQHGGWSYYDPNRHGLVPLGILGNALTGVWNNISQVIEPESAIAMVFIAEPGKVYSKYEFGDSLVWRDAGALIGHMGLVAEALQLNFCPLGITGEPWTSRLNGKRQLVGAGVALLGSKLCV